MSDDTKQPSFRLRPIIKRYAKATSKYPWYLAACFAGVVLAESAAVSGSYALKKLIDTVSSQLPTAEIVQVAYLTLAVFFIIALVGWVGRRLRDIYLSIIEPYVMEDLSDEAFSYLLHHSHDFFISNFSGTLTRRVTRYARAYESILDAVFFQFLSTGFFIIGILVVLGIKSPLLAATVLFWTVVYIASQAYLINRIHSLRVKRSAEDSAMTGAISDSIVNHHSVVLFGHESHETGLFNSVVTRWRKATIRSWVADSWVWGVSGLLTIAAEVGLLAYGIHNWGLGIFTVGDIVLIQAYIIALIEKVFGINRAIRSLYDSFADAYEMVAIFEQPHDIQDNAGAATLTVPKGEILFDAVDFTFTGEQGILHDYTLNIKQGEKVALVGPSGAGKSTVTKLLLRLYDPTGGKITIDGQDISKVTQQSLRRNLSYVPQEATLFHRSLLDNIRYGKLDATDDEVIEASRKAHAYEFISRLPEKYGTLVGERGVKLSGGERQRIAIARAMLKNAPILVLDEATASLDSQSEHYIQDALSVLMEHKTVIVIAHRLSTIMNMDRIVVMEHGRVVAEGTHAELLEQGGLYAKLWNIQAGGFLADQEEEV